MSLEDIIRQTIREELAPLKEEIRAALKGGGTGQQLVPIATAASISSLSPATITRWLNSGKLKRHGTGRMTRVDLAELRRRLAEQGATKAKAPAEADIEETARHLLAGGR